MRIHEKLRSDKRTCVDFFFARRWSQAKRTCFTNGNSSALEWHETNSSLVLEMVPYFFFFQMVCGVNGCRHTPASRQQLLKAEMVSQHMSSIVMNLLMFNGKKSASWIHTRRYRIIKKKITKRPRNGTFEKLGRWFYRGMELTWRKLKHHLFSFVRISDLTKKANKP